MAIDNAVMAAISDAEMMIDEGHHVEAIRRLDALAKPSEPEIAQRYFRTLATAAVNESNRLRKESDDLRRQGKIGDAIPTLRKSIDYSIQAATYAEGALREGEVVIRELMRSNL